MIKAHLDDKSAVPVWAAVGVPLIGVPLMVALLALTSPRETPATDHEAVVGTEQVELQNVDQEKEMGAEEADLPFLLG